MSPPCKWELGTLVSNTKPLPGALLETFATHLFFCLTFFQQKRHGTKVGFLCVFDQLQPLYRFFKLLSWLSLSPGLLSFKHWNQFRSGCYNPLMFFWNLLLLFPTSLTPLSCQLYIYKAFREGFLLAHIVVSCVCRLKGDQRQTYWLCCLILKTGIEILLWRDRCSYVGIAVTLAGEAFYSL